jgi:hypothetical protein
MEFAHNARTHSATGHSPFQVWYGYQPDFIPPLNFATTIPTVEDRLRSLDQIRNEVTAALKVAAETMKRSGPAVLSNVFKEGDLVWLEGTNIHTTHPKAKLAPRRHGPFKVLYSTATNTKLLLPKSWRIHPMFHNSLISPYKETTAHGPNYTRPPPDIVEGEDEHYEVETVLQSRLTPNRRGVQYLVKWKGYPDSENSWLPASGMKHATDLVQQFHAKNPRSPKPSSIHALQAQQDLKEGILLRTGPRNKKFQEHVTVRRSPDKSRDSGSLSGLRNQSPDRSHARSHAQSPARSPARSPALVHLSGPQRNKRTGPEHGTSPSSIEEAIQKIPLARGSRSTPTHRPDGSHERGNDSRG